MKDLAGVFIAVELDAVDPVFTHDTAPQCTITVENQAFFCAALQRAYEAGKVLRIQVQEGFPERRFPKVAAAMIEPLFGAKNGQIEIPIGQTKSRCTFPDKVFNKSIERDDLRRGIGAVGRKHNA